MKCVRLSSVGREVAAGQRLRSDAAVDVDRAAVDRLARRVAQVGGRPALDVFCQTPSR